MRLAIGIVLAVCLALVLFLGLRVEWDGSRSSGLARRARDPALTRAAPDPAAAPPAIVAPVAEARAAIEAQREADAESRAVPSMRVLVRGAVDGRPIEAALVTYFDRATPIPQRTGDDGACVLPLVSPEQPAQLLVEAAGHFHAHERRVPESKLWVDLFRSARLEGRVLAADTGQPVVGATLALRREGYEGCEDERGHSAGDGRYEIPSVPLYSPIILEVRAEGFGTAWRVFELRGDARRTAQDIHLVRGTEIEGRVEDWISGSAIAGARVEELETDAEGHFRGRVQTRGPRAGTSFRVEAAGYASLDVMLELAHEPELVFRLPRPAFLAGRILDPQGQPLADASVSFTAEGPIGGEDALVQETSPIYEVPEGWSYSLAESASSDREGRYRLPVLPWSLNGTAVASARGMGETARLKSIGEPGLVQRLDWEMRMRPSPSTLVTGGLRLNGQAAGEGTVTWRGPTRSGSGRSLSGRYELEVEPGELVLAAVLDFAPHVPSSVVAVRLLLGDQRRVVLDVEAPSASIAGRVSYEDGAPVADVRVYAGCRWEAGSSYLLMCGAVTNEKGEYELLVTDIGRRFDVFAKDLEGGIQRSDAIAPGARGVDFVLGRAYRCFVRAREARTGAALDEEVQFFARADPSYGFEPLRFVSDVPDAGGWYEVWIAAPVPDLLALPRAQELSSYGTSLLRRAQLTAREAPCFDFELEPGLELAVYLEEGAEAWPAGHWLYLVEEDLAGELDPERPTHLDELASRSQVAFDGAGRATLRGLASGTYRFLVFPDDLLVEPELVRLDASRRSTAVRWSYRE